MSETRKVVRREPVSMTAHRLDRDDMPDWFIPDDTNDHPVHGWHEAYFTDEQFHDTFIDADRAADLAWNAVIEGIVDRLLIHHLVVSVGVGYDAEVDACNYEIDKDVTEDVVEYLESFLRPIAPAEGERDDRRTRHRSGGVGGR